MVDLVKASEGLRGKYKIQVKHSFNYGEAFHELPGQVFVNSDGVYIAEYKGDRIIKFDSAFNQAEVLSYHFDKPAGFVASEEGIWLCGFHQKRLFYLGKFGGEYRLEREYDLLGEQPIWIREVPGENIYIVHAYQQQNNESSLWKLELGELFRLGVFSKGYNHLSIYDRHILLLDSREKCLCRFDFLGNFVEKISLEYTDFDGISSFTSDEWGNVFVISANNYLYKFEKSGRLVFRSDLLLRRDLRIRGGFNANLVCYDETLYLADIRNGILFALAI